MDNITDNNLDNLNNSHAAKEQRAQTEKKPDTKPVAKGKVKEKKEESKSLLQTFFKHDAKSIWDYLYSRVLDPTVRKLFYDLVTNTVHMILYDGTKKDRSVSSRADQVSYRKYYDEPEYESRRERPVRSYQQISFDTKEAAQSVLDRMEEIVDVYRFVSIADYYDLSNVPDGSYTDNDYGWRNLNAVEVIADSDGGWIIDLPKPRPRR